MTNAEEYKQYLEERKLLIDAARESARTFDQAVLAFGAAVFGSSVAFLKDVVSTPALWSLKWLATSWVAFSLGLLAILLSFLFSHRACMHEIDVGAEALGKPDYKRKKNGWSIATNWCNGLSVGLLFIGILCWSRFAFINLSIGGVPVNKVQSVPEKRGYVPPSPPAKAPDPQQGPSEPGPPANRKPASDTVGAKDGA